MIRNAVKPQNRTESPHLLSTMSNCPYLIVQDRESESHQEFFPCSSLTDPLLDLEVGKASAIRVVDASQVHHLQSAVASHQSQSQMPSGKRRPWGKERVPSPSSRVESVEIWFAPPIRLCCEWHEQFFWQLSNQQAHPLVEFPSDRTAGSLQGSSRYL